MPDPEPDAASDALPSSLRADLDGRPVTVLGAGTLGRRIALMFAAGGSSVRLVNRTREHADDVVRFVAEQLPTVREALGLAAPPGRVEVADDLADGLAGAWLVVESLAEDLDLKRRTFAELDARAEPDALLATNSSSFPSSEMIDGVTHPARVLNLHFLMPPQMNAVELMSCGQTDEAALDGLQQQLPRYGLIPFRVRRESVGFIFNRVWAAIKRETLMVVEEGVATPEEVDAIWRVTLGTDVGPFRLMDRVGLDVVLAIEEHYAHVRDGIPDGPRELLREYLDQGRLGLKSGRGFYDDYGDPTG
jgi:3-hydroxybutyryl-CoA dehydrogenase